MIHLKQQHIIQQLTAKDALIDALISLYHNATKCQQNDNLNKFIQLYKPVYHDILKSKLSIKDFQIIHKDSFAEGAFGKVTIVKSKENDIYAMKTSNKLKLINQMDRSSPMEERLIMSITTDQNDHWFPRLHASFQDENNLYLVMEYASGGDLQGLLERRSFKPFTEQEAKFYSAELILAVERLHQLGYMHRDIKPGNIFIDKTGHIKLGDLGSCISIDTNDYLFMVGTMPYVSPEMCDSEGSNPVDGPAYGPEVDWWSVGIVLYELLYGDTPFTGTDIKIQMSLLNPKVEVQFSPDVNISTEAKDLLSSLLAKDKEKRLGYCGVQEIKAHPFFSSIDWDTIRNSATPPFIPTITSPDDNDFQDDLNDNEYPFIGYTYIHRNTNDSELQQKTNNDTETHQQEIERLQQQVQELKSQLALQAQPETKASKLDERLLQLEKKEKLKLQDQIARLKQDYEQQLKKVQQERASLQASFHKQLLEKEKLQAALEINHASAQFKETIENQQQELEKMTSEIQDKTQLYEQQIKSSQQRIVELQEEKKICIEHLSKEHETKINDLEANIQRLKDKLEYEAEKSNKLKEKCKQKLKDQYQDYKLLIQQSRDESSSLKQQLAKQQEEQEKRHYGQKKSLPHVPITGSSSARLNSPGEGRSILATMWKRDRDSLRTVQQALEDSEDQLAFAKRQVLRLKKE
ncbi:hypothetical protein CU098_002028, partial [Rhizopus stolonifer]